MYKKENLFRLSANRTAEIIAFGKAIKFCDEESGNFVIITIDQLEELMIKIKGRRTPKQKLFW